MNPVLAMLGRRLRLAVIGGGPGSFIGPVHRTAARLDDRFEIVAGVLSTDPARSRNSGRHRHRGRARLCRLGGAARWRAGARRRRRRRCRHDPQWQPPRHLRRALERGFDLICDKPLTTSLADAADLVRRVRASGRVFCLTHNYTAYPMVRQARDMVRAGDMARSARSTPATSRATTRRGSRATAVAGASIPHSAARR